MSTTGDQKKEIGARCILRADRHDVFEWESAVGRHVR